MKFLLLMQGDEQKMLSLSAEEIADSMSAYAAYGEALVKAGVVVGGERLKPSAESTCVEERNGQVQMIDGPYADTREQLGGYMLIDVPTREDALQWAARCPAAKVGTVEVRPVWEG